MLWFSHWHLDLVDLAERAKVFTAISRKVVGKNVHATIPKGNMGYDRCTVSDVCSCRTYICCFPLVLANTFSWPFVPILSHFSEKQWTQNHPQCLSGLSHTLFPTTFLEIAVYGENLARLLTRVTVVHWLPCIQKPYYGSCYHNITDSVRLLKSMKLFVLG